MMKLDYKWLPGLLLVLCLALSVTGCGIKNPLTGNPVGSGDPVYQVGNDGIADCVKDQIVVRLKPGVNINSVLPKVNGRVIRYNAKLDYYVVEFQTSDTMSIATAKNILRNASGVKVAEANYIARTCAVLNDPDVGMQWGFENINAAAGWDLSTGTNTVVIAILDTGVDDTHPDLTGKVTFGYDAIAEVAGLPGDIHGHGTHCAGIAAAAGNNGTGGAGVAFNCALMAVQVLGDDGSGTYEDIAEGIVWAVDHGADVISMSLGGDGYSRILQDAVDYAFANNVPVVAAAGNSGRLNDQHYPSAYPGVIAVGASNPQNQKASFSTESNYLFISAPGEMILSTLPDGGYGFMSGTSMATPFVSGAVALIKSRFGASLTVNQIRSQLKTTVTDIGDMGWDQKTGWGLLNLSDALNTLQSNIYGLLRITVDDGAGVYQAGASVLISDSYNQTVANVLTNESGEAVFLSLEAGSYNIFVEKDGCRETVLTTISVNVEKQVDIHLAGPAL